MLPLIVSGFFFCRNPPLCPQQIYIISEEIAEKALEALLVDKIGLDLVDREVLKTIIAKFNGGPVGIDTIAASIR